MHQEQVDILDPQGLPTGHTIPKKDAHQQGLWHSSAHIWIYNSRGEILLQRRSSTKDTFPSMWDISVAGHISAGEAPITGALREIAEEIGYKVSETDLHYIGTIKMDYYYAPKDWTNREYCYVYLMCYDGAVEDLTIQEEELDELRFFSYREFQDLIKADRAVAVPHQDYYDWVFGHFPKSVVKKTV